MIVNAQLWGKVLVCYLIAVNVLAFALMGIDKHKARCGAWRISEKALFLPVLLGGGAGAAWGCGRSTTRPSTGISASVSP